MKYKRGASTWRPQGLRTAVWLAIALCLLVFCAWVNWRLFRPLGFEAPTMWRTHLRSIIFIDTLQAMTFIVAIVALRLTLRRLTARTMAWFVIAASVLVLGISVATLPTRSQDFYHDALLIQNYVASGDNPYTTTPAEIGGPWMPYLFAWFDVGYIYGPLFAVVLAAVMTVQPSLLTVVLVIKLLSVVAVGLTAWLMWRIMRQRPLVQKVMAIALFCLNPLTIQAGIVDVHADIFMGLGITAGYYFYAERHYVWSLWMLLFAGLGKFVSAVLMPLPLLGILFSRKLRPFQKAKGIVLFSITGLTVTSLVFSPFGFREALNGISVMTSFRLPSYESLGSLFLMDGLGLSVFTVRLLGAVLAVGSSIWLFRRSISPRQFIIPIALFLFIGFPIFQPWYLLWILPLVCVSERYWVVLALSAPFSLLSPNINYSVWKATSIFVLLVIAGILCKNLPIVQQRRIVTQDA